MFSKPLEVCSDANKTVNMRSADVNLKAIKFRLFLYNLGLIFVVGFSFYYYTLKTQYYIAVAISENLHNELSFEDRSVVLRKLSNLVPSSFSKILVNFVNTEPVVIEADNVWIEQKVFLYVNDLTQSHISFYSDFSGLIVFMVIISFLVLSIGNFLSKRYLNYLLKKIENRYKTQNAIQLAELSQQVAHDIRSPLTALNMLVASLKDFPEDKIEIINSVSNRINDIANDLLRESKFDTRNNSAFLGTLSSNSSVELKTDLEQVLNADLFLKLDNLIKEKQAQIINNSNLKLYLDNHLNDLFLNTEVCNQLLRVISNLINNSIEAIGDRKGEIFVSIREYSDLVLIAVSDTGPGIPEEIISKFGTKGLTTKSQGNGLGLFHAKATLEGLGGSLSVISQLNNGTMITLNFPKKLTPS